jgi:hypothetical protein
MIERTEEERKTYNRNKMQASRDRQRERLAKEMAALARQATSPDAPKLARLAALILQAQTLADTLREIQSMPADLPATQRLLDAYKGKEIRITLPKVDLPT